MDHNQNRNHPFPNTRLSLGHNPLILPTNNSAVNVSNSTAYPNIPMRLVDHPLPNFHPQYPNNWTASPGLLHNTYTHCSTSVNPHNFSSHHMEPAPAFFPQTTGDDLDTIEMDNRRVALKRKNPAIPICSGSSSNLPFPPHYMQPKPISVSGPECWPSDPTRMVFSNWNDNILTAGEGSQRNVRSRQNHAFPFEFDPAVSYSSNMPQPFYSNANMSGLHMPEQWNHCPVSMPPEGSNYSGNLSINGPTMISSAYHPVQNQNMNVPMMTFNGPFNQPQGIEAIHNNYALRTGPQGTVSSYSSMGSSLNSLRGSMQFQTEVAATSRQPVVVGHSSSRRNGRQRFMTIDQSVLYGSREMSDQHRDMRLDIDNMSYEELLALGERIGYVSTGLPDELISRCLTQTVYCAPNENQDDQEEGNCIICLEEYGNGDHVGGLNCGHDFHATCIRKWLRVKNLCPICKATTSKETPKE
uniref:RING-type E3 ubiquitin transferase n=1 Tax=Ananas comosus var. bracteatus TaxID=296719 RepID=A0A6V7QFS5_ANACO|nr:unnamed protein product [Ananas comosus var. bracteatus]